MNSYKKLPKQIKKGHKLLFSQQDLTQREADIFALMMISMKPTDWDQLKTPVYTYTAAQITEYLGIKSSEIGKTLNPVADRLTKKNIGIPTGDENEFDYVGIFKRVKYKDRLLTVIPNDELKEAFIDYQNGFALINSKPFFSLNREYSKRLYEILSRFKDSRKTKMQDFGINDLKGLFGLLQPDGNIKPNKKSFKNNRLFIDRCIESSIMHIESDLLSRKEILFYDGEDSFTDQVTHGYQVLRKGRNITGIRFLYRWVSDTKGLSPPLEDYKKLIIDLETKRSNGSILSTTELHSLSEAYIALGKLDIAMKIEQSISNRSFADEEEQVEDDQEDFFAKLSVITGDKHDY